MSNKNAFLAKFQSQNHRISQDDYEQKINEIFSLSHKFILQYLHSLGMGYLLENRYFMESSFSLGDILVVSKLELEKQINDLMMSYSDKLDQDKLFREPFISAVTKIDKLDLKMTDYVSKLADEFAGKLNKTIDRSNFLLSTYNILKEYSNFITNDKDYTTLEQEEDDDAVDNLVLITGLWQLATKGIYEKYLPHFMLEVANAESINIKKRELTNDIIEKVFNFMLDKINNTLEMNIEVTAIEFLSAPTEEEFKGFVELWEEAIRNEPLAVFSMVIERFPIITEEDIPLNTTTYEEPQPDSKASAAILKFFDSNSNALIAKLKDSGLQLSASALQNDQNITRVANVVYNLLPGMVRIFVSFDTVENFLLEHRQWLINKLI